jgi:hypothetical protein
MNNQFSSITGSVLPLIHSLSKIFFTVNKAYVVWAAFARTCLNAGVHAG